MRSDEIEKHLGMGDEERRKILVVGRGGAFSEEVMDYAIHLAARLDYDLLALCVQGVGPQDSGIQGGRALQAARIFQGKADREGVRCGHVLTSGQLGSAVEELNHRVKRIELVVIDSGVNQDEIAQAVTIPMFSVISHSLDSKGDHDMASEQIIQQKKPMGKTIGYGVLTTALYAAVFWNADAVMQTFTKGGWYAALPVATVFLFSFVHGTFAHNLWSLLGIEANQKPALRQTEQKVLQKKKTAQKRPRVYAYVNPFHRIDR
jgi:hypothetical protein